MDQVKSWLLSKTIWAAAFGVLVQLLTMLHINVPELASLDANVFAGNMVNIISGVFFILAIVFRASATHKVG